MSISALNPRRVSVLSRPRSSLFPLAFFYTSTSKDLTLGRAVVFAFLFRHGQEKINELVSGYSEGNRFAKGFCVIYCKRKTLQDSALQ